MQRTSSLRFSVIHTIALLSLIAGSTSTAQQPDAHSIEVINALIKTAESTKIAAEVAGRIDVLEVSIGGRVKAGEIVGKVRDQAVQLEVQTAKINMALARKRQRNDIDIRLAKKQEKVAESELQDAIDANKELAGTYTEREVQRLSLIADTASLSVERAEQEAELLDLEVLKAENEYKKADERLARHQVIAPSDGLIVSVSRNAGEWVEPGTELFEIVKIDRLRVEGFLSAKDLQEGLEGAKARIVVAKASGNIELEGKVIFVDPVVNAINGNPRIVLEFDNRELKFRPGMRVQATIKAPSERPSE